MAEGALTRSASCAQCGAIFHRSSQRGPIRKRCDPCHSDAKRARTRFHVANWKRRKDEQQDSYPCEGCGVGIRKSKFCSADCRSDWYKRTGYYNKAAISRERLRGVRPIAEVNAERLAQAKRIQCPECRIEFRPTRHGNHRNGPQKYCSLDCLHAESRRANAIAALVDQDRAMYRRWGIAARRAIAEAAPDKLCRDCGAEVDKGKQRCQPCRDIAAKASKLNRRNSPGYRAQRSRAKARRRMREREQRVEAFDPFAIFERDKWRCHICGCNTPKRLRGTFEPNAPELDHIIPLASGGEHSRRNTACSCRRCNIMKADKPLGQLMMAV